MSPPRWRAPYGLTEVLTTVDDRPVRSLVAGSRDDAPEVVVLPGLGAPGYLAPWALETARWTRVSLLDLPGWRRGRARSCRPTLDDVVTTAGRWLQATGRRDVVLLGHSTGAQAVLRVALQRPDRVAGIVLAGPTFDPAARTVPALLRRAAATIVREEPAELRAVGPSYLGSGLVPLVRFALTALPDRPEDAAGSVTAPVLVLTGEGDRLAPPAWARTLARAASGECVVLPGAHNAPFPHPRLADAAVRQWLARRPLASGGRGLRP